MVVADVSRVIRRGNIYAFHWRHNERDGVSNHQRIDCLLIHLFRHRSKKTSKLRVTGLFKGNPPVIPVVSPHKGLVTRKMFPLDDVIMHRVTAITVNTVPLCTSQTVPTVAHVQTLPKKTLRRRCLMDSIDSDIDERPVVHPMNGTLHSTSRVRGLRSSLNKVYRHNRQCYCCYCHCYLGFCNVFPYNYSQFSFCHSHHYHRPCHHYRFIILLSFIQRSNLCICMPFIHCYKYFVV